MNHSRNRSTAFTLTELLVVVLIIAALLVVAVPAFTSIVYSSEASMADNLIQVGLRAGRDTALRSASRDDGAVVFAYEPAPGGGRIVMIPCVRVAEYSDLPAIGTTTPILREVFVAADLAEPIQMPKSWSIRGYARVNTIENQGWWYDGSRYGQNLRRGDWVFPETGFFTEGVLAEGRFRQTFMVRFEAGSGRMINPAGVPALVFLPPVTPPPAMATLPQTTQQELKALRMSNPRKYVLRVLADTQITDANKRLLLGSDSPDMVLARATTSLSLYDERKMARDLRTQVDPDTGCLYKRHITNQQPTFVPVATQGGNLTDDDAQSGQIMDQWIEGDTNLSGAVQSRRNGDEPEARIFTIDRYTGTLKRVETQR